MAAPFSLEQFFGSSSFESPAIGVGNERDKGCASDRLTAVVLGAGQNVANRTQLYTASPSGDGTHLRQAGNNGIWVPNVPGSVSRIKKEVEDAAAVAGVALPPNWGTNGNLFASLALNGGDQTRANENDASLSLNLTESTWANFGQVVPVGGAVPNPGLLANLNGHATDVAHGGWTVHVVDRPNSLKLGFDQIRVKMGLRGKIDELAEAFKKHVSTSLDQGCVCEVRPGAVAHPAGTQIVPPFTALGRTLVVYEPHAPIAAGGNIPNAVPTPPAGSELHLIEILVGTLNMLRETMNKVQHNALVAAGLPAPGAVPAGPAFPLPGILPNGIWLDTVVVQSMPTAAPVGGGRRASLIGSSIPNGAPGAAAGDRAQAAATAAGEKVLFAGLTTLNSTFDSTANRSTLFNSLAANSIIKTHNKVLNAVGTHGRTITPGDAGSIALSCLFEYGCEGWELFGCETVFVRAANAVPAVPPAVPAPSTAVTRASNYGSFWDLTNAFFGAWVGGSAPPETVDVDEQDTWLGDNLAPYGSFASAAGRNHVQHGHTTGGGSPITRFELAKVTVVADLADKRLHSKAPGTALPGAFSQAAANLNSILHPACHGHATLASGAYKSGRACGKVGVFIPVLKLPFFGAFNNFDAQRSKETLIPKGQAWAGYATEALKIAAMNKAQPVLAAEMDLDAFQEEVSKVFRKNWAGHEKSASWRDMKSNGNDEFGTDVRTIVTKSKDDVATEMSLLKGIVTTFAPKSSLLATEGFDNIGDPDVTFLTDLQAHKKTLRSKLSTQEAEVYNMLLSSGKPSLMQFAKTIAKLVAADSVNGDAIKSWGNAVAQGNLAGPPTVGNEGSAVAGVVAYVAANLRAVGKVYGLAKVDVNPASRF